MVGISHKSLRLEFGAHSTARKIPYSKQRALPYLGFNENLFYFTSVYTFKYGASKEKIIYYNFLAEFFMENLDFF